MLAQNFLMVTQKIILIVIWYAYKLLNCRVFGKNELKHTCRTIILRLLSLLSCFSSSSSSSPLLPCQGVLDLLANRCLAQGTNAWTDVDHTCYTVTTAGSEGFLNLLPIYLDHILYPTLSVGVRVTLPVFYISLLVFTVHLLISSC